MKQRAIICGSSWAGLQAALDLGDAGYEVHIIDPAPFLGDDPHSGVPQHIVNTRLLEITKHPQITLWPDTAVTQLERAAHGLRAHVRRNPRYVKLDRCTACGDCLEACPVQVSETDHKAIDLKRMTQPGAAAIFKQGRSPCSYVCPGGIAVQGYVALIAQQRFQEAIDLIREAVPFPGILGRICTHPCEVNCRRCEIDQPVAIRQLKRFVADWETAQQTAPPPLVSPSHRSGAETQRVAIVGAGPAGMTVADRLVRWGYGVTVFDKLPVRAGMLAVGIPSYRLPRAVIDQEYRRIEQLGVEMRLNTAIGPDGDLTLDDLFSQGFNAVCLAIGAHKGLSLRIAGEDLPGVVQGIELLKAVSLSQHLQDESTQACLNALLPLGRETRAAVLGGGNTAMDVARTLKRLDLTEVSILYRRTREEMPALPEEIEETEAEGLTIQFLTAPKRIIGDPATGVTALECLRMELGPPDDSGRRRPIPITGSEFEIPLDLVVLAIGQVPDFGCLGSDPGIGITREQRIQVNPAKFATQRPGVFAAGDAVTHDKMSAIEAIGMGKRAAAAIDAYLQQKKIAKVPAAVTVEPLPEARPPLSKTQQIAQPRIAMPAQSAATRVSGFDEIEQGYTPEMAVAEAQRCVACGPCSECGACVQVCEAAAIDHGQIPQESILEVQAVLYADPTQSHLKAARVDGDGIWHAAPHDPLAGAAGAAQMMHHMGPTPNAKPAQTQTAIGHTPTTLGLFICQCGGAISEHVDTQALRQAFVRRADMALVEIVPMACTPEGTRHIRQASATPLLGGAVLAACSCCDWDQVCFSCTLQRVRCKQQLGIVGHHTGPPQGPHPAGDVAFPGLPFEFVNIREQCAWAHSNDVRAATAKATRMIAAALARVCQQPQSPTETARGDRSVMILGTASSGDICEQFLTAHNISVQRVAEAPHQVLRHGGRYITTRNGITWETAGVVLSPQNNREQEQLLRAFGPRMLRPSPRPYQAPLATHRPGVLMCDPLADGSVGGAAAAAHMVGWLERWAVGHNPHAALVDVHRCRACGTCIETCAYGAPWIDNAAEEPAARIDPVICQACGTCAARCPSGAITAMDITDSQMEATLSVVGHGMRHEETA